MIDHNGQEGSSASDSPDQKEYAENSSDAEKRSALDLSAPAENEKNAQTQCAPPPARSRTQSASKNIAFSLLSLLVTSILAFVCRRVFIVNLGAMYLGLNSLFSNVISMLSLVELGIGSAIVYSLYAPLANGNHNESAALVKLYAKVYRLLALAVLTIGLLLLPFLQLFVKNDVSMQLAKTVFVLYLLDNAISYLFSHKRSLLLADQKAYVASSIDLLFKITISAAQIAALVITKNLLLFVSLQLVLNLINNLVVNHIVDRKYRDILTIKGANLPATTKKTIVKNIKALFMHKVGDYCLNATDNLVLSYFINLSIVGIYSSYYMVVSMFDRIIAQVFNATIASYGNLIATDTKESTYDRFLIGCFLNFWVVNTLTVLLYFTLNPLIEVWLGSQYMIGQLAYCLLILNFYLRTMRYSLFSVKSAAGLYDQDKFAPLIQGGINLMLTLILVKPFGLAGVLMGSAISSLAVPVWVQPYIVHKYVFEKSIATYAKRYLLSVALLALLIIIFRLVLGPDEHPSWLSLIYRSGVLLSLTSAAYYILFRKNKDYRYLMGIIAGKMSFRKGRSNEAVG